MRVESAPRIGAVYRRGDRPGDARTGELGAVGVEVVLAGPQHRVDRVADDDLERDRAEQGDLGALSRGAPDPGGGIPVMQGAQRAKVQFLIAQKRAVERLKARVVGQVGAAFWVAEKATENLPAGDGVQWQVSDVQVAKVPREQAATGDRAPVGVNLYVRVLRPRRRRTSDQNHSDENRSCKARQRQGRHQRLGWTGHTSRSAQHGTSPCRPVKTFGTSRTFRV